MWNPVACIVLSATISMLARDAVGDADHRTSKDCTYDFHVWQPNSDELLKIRTIEIRFGNFTNYVDSQLSQYQVSRMRDVADYRNWSLVQERELGSLRADQLHKYGELQELRFKLSVFENSLGEMKEKMSEMSELSTSRKSARRRHVRKDRMVPVHASQADTPRHHSFDTLKSMISDLKAEWILLKRDFIGIKNDNQGIRTEQASLRNKSLEINSMLARLKTVVMNLQAAESRLTRDISDVIGKVGQQTRDILTMKSDREGESSDLRDQETALTTLQASMIDMRRGLADMKTSLNKLRTDVTRTEGARVGSAWTPRSVDINLVDGGIIYPKDCEDVSRQGYVVSGVYHIKPDTSMAVTDVYCDIDVNNVYTVIQRRIDGLQNFNRGWLEYKYGFGNVYGEFWAGNELIRALTKDGNAGLRIDILDWEGNATFAEYDEFSVSDESSRYVLHVRGYHGTAGDSLSYHDGMKFSTNDLDNDVHERNCAADNRGGWWFAECFFSHLNGVYHVGWYSQPKFTFADGVVWYTLRDSDRYSLRKVEMKLKRRISRN